MKEKTMKKTTRLLSLILALLLLLATVLTTLASCQTADEPEENDPPKQTEHEHEFSSAWISNATHHWHPATCEHTDEMKDKALHTVSEGKCTVCGWEEPKDEPAPEKTTYSVTLKTIGGLGIENVTVFIVDVTSPDVPLGFGTTAADGSVTLSVEKKDGVTLGVKLLSVPKGYTADDVYPVTGKSMTVTLEPSIIDEEEYKGTAYKLGDVMYDFTLTTIDGDTVKLSELIAGGKRGVLLNFWFSSCTPCRSEFPHIQAVYERYKDDIAILAINPTGEDDFTLKTFRDEFGLTFDVINGGETLNNAFGVSAYPTSVFIDKYGTVTFMVAGSLPSERPFEALFSKACAENYTQVIYNSVEELLPREVCDVEMEPSEVIGGVFDSGDLDVNYYPETESSDSEYSWPFATTEKDGYPCIKPINSHKDESFATIHADIVLKKGDALIFDYYSSTEAGVDMLYVLVDGIDIVVISGDPKEWRTCCTFVAPEDETYTVTFIYVKDGSDDVGEDTVYLKNLRVGTVEDIDTPTYIQREAATDPLPSGDGFASYATVVLNPADGYYHVGDENGPLLLADLMAYTNFSRENSIYGYAYDGLISKGGVNYYDEIVAYCNYASNATISGLCTVNEELAELLKITAEVVGDGLYNPNDWLEICKYYDAYGTDGEQLADPIKGLATHSAYTAVANGAEDGEDVYPNTVTYDRIIMPRGLLYEFIPEVTGVYRITSNSKSEVDGWLFDADGNEILAFDHIERFIDYGMQNVSMVYYMEAGTPYYIDIAFHEVTEMGSFTFKIEYEAPTLALFTAASPGFFTYLLDENGEITNTLIAGGIDVKLGEDGYYHRLYKDGTLGDIVYADFTMYTNLFPTGAIYNVANPDGASLINQGAFDFSKSETDREALMRGYDKMTDDELRALWGENFDENFEIYAIADLREGKYHGEAEDYTERMIEIASTLMLNSTNCTDENLYGCVPVDEELANILQLLVDHASFRGVRNSWTKVCYCYQYYGADAKA